MNGQIREIIENNVKNYSIDEVLNFLKVNLEMPLNFRNFSIKLGSLNENILNNLACVVLRYLQNNQSFKTKDNISSLLQCIWSEDQELVISLMISIGNSQKVNNPDTRHRIEYDYTAATKIEKVVEQIAKYFQEVEA